MTRKVLDASQGLRAAFGHRQPLNVFTDTVEVTKTRTQNGPNIHIQPQQTQNTGFKVLF